MHFRAPILMYFMTVILGTGAQLTGSNSYFYKWREHTEYRLPVTSLEITYKARSEAECGTVCSGRTGFQPCAGFAFVLNDDDWVCTLAIKDSSGSRPNLMKTSYSDDLYINVFHRELQVTEETNVITEDEATTVDPVYTIPDNNIDRRQDAVYSGTYIWLSTITMGPVTVAYNAYCNPPTAECIIMDHESNMKLDTRDCTELCAGICELHP